MARSECPFCGETTPVNGKIFLGKDVLCEACEGTSQVVKLAPVELDYYYEGEEEEIEYGSYGYEEEYD